MPPSISPADNDAVIAQLPRSPSGEGRYEFSVKAAAGRLSRQGRFTLWLDGAVEEDCRAMADWLTTVGAPAQVLAAHAAAPNPLYQGAAVSIGRGGIDYRLYLHGRTAETQADNYEALRWTAGAAEARWCRYTFYFAPETPGGDRPQALAPPWARDGIAALADDATMRRISGFWLRTDAAGRLDQIDLAMPWSPVVGDLPGAALLIDKFDLAEDDRHWLRALPVRHVAVPSAEAGVDATATFYCAGILPTPPETEAALQDGVIAAAHHAGRLAASQIAALPPQPRVIDDRGGIDHFYSGEIALWQAALGVEMHYHHALFETPEPAPDDAAMLAASRRGVSELYPFIPAGSSVYDIGCGWGGPLNMLVRERGCRAIGATIARNQFRYVSAMGLPVRWADAERTLPPGRFDCILLLESFEHMQDKPTLLRLLTSFSDRLVMRINCQDMAPASTEFGGSMPMVSSSALRTMLEDAGWRIAHWRNRRAEARPSAAAWHRRLSALPPTDDHHLETFRHWAWRVDTLGDAWGDNNPLIELVAER